MKFLIGHRGVGKTTLVRALGGFDLDACIEEFGNCKVNEIFASKGEAHFRDLERQSLVRILENLSEGVVALGAGFEAWDLVRGNEVIWVRRDTDAAGRIFLDRPRLLPKISALEEFQVKRRARDLVFEREATEELWLNEGEGVVVPMREPNMLPAGAVLTLFPGMQNRLNFWKKIGISRFEIRDDHPDAEVWLHSLKGENLIWARRDSWKSVIPSGVSCDWALELGEAPIDSQIISAHNGHLGDVLGGLDRYAGRNAILKAAPLIENFEDLWIGHQWQAQDPAQRVFLPRSLAGGRWRWYRTLFASEQAFWFTRFGHGIDDQPRPHDLDRLPQKPVNGFAAVLGDPVSQSFGPAFHRGFFEARHMAYVAIPIVRGSLASALPVLEKLGMRAASVTAPLKGEVRGGAANTMWISEGVWSPTNTDARGFAEAVVPQLSGSGSVAVWGGGGILKTLAPCFPSGTVFYSAPDGPSAGWFHWNF